MQGVEKLDHFLRSSGVSQIEFARRYKISQPYLNQIINGKRAAGKKTAEYLEKVTQGAVKKHDLRPDIWV